VFTLNTIIVVAISAVIAIAVLGVMSSQVLAEKKVACEAKGGDLVVSRSGPVLCIKKEAVIPL
jgi:hypothetical protein